ncbi:MAG TPA: hypothetical protein VES73_09870, partial [Lamprocystis sp. (in: g-proteobacteria)]|nr:hypothetical protein [Lamprocystis sp. (in: g-proteobacteria)]
ELAEGLCKHAKVMAKKARESDEDPVPSALSFHRVTTAFVDEYPVILDRELTANGLRQTLECYAIEGGSGLPALDDLLRLQRLLADKDHARGAARELLGLIGRSPEQASRHYARWREVMIDKQPGQIKTFDDALARLGVLYRPGGLPYCGEDGAGIRRSPLGDVLTLNAVGNRIEPPADAAQEPTR